MVLWENITQHLVSFPFQCDSANRSGVFFVSWSAILFCNNFSDILTDSLNIREIQVRKLSASLAKLTQRLVYTRNYTSRPRE